MLAFLYKFWRKSSEIVYQRYQFTQRASMWTSNVATPFLDPVVLFTESEVYMSGDHRLLMIAAIHVDLIVLDLQVLHQSYQK